MDPKEENKAPQEKPQVIKGRVLSMADSLLDVSEQNVYQNLTRPVFRSGI